MPATIADLGARVLRRLGVVMVADADRPPITATVPKGEIAARALRMVGINPVAAPNKPAPDTSVFTAEEIGTRALRTLGVVASDEVPAGLDLLDAANKIRALHEGLNRQGFAEWSSTAIPLRAAEPYTVIVAAMLAPGYGKTPETQAGLAAMASAAQVALRDMALSGDNGHAIALAAVDSIHAGLVAQGLANWTVDAIPAAVAEDIATLTANQLGPVYGKPIADAAGIEARVRRVAMLLRAQADAEEGVFATHATLAARHMVKWTIHDIPDWAEQPYVVLTAADLAPQFERPRDDAAAERAMRDIIVGMSLRTSGETTPAEYF